MHKKILAAALTLGLTTLAAGAMASPRGHAEGYATGYRDGYINGRTVAHANPAPQMFRKLDRNNNGVISSREFSRQYGNNRASWRAFARLDTNRDGVLSLREIASGQRFIASL